MTLLRRDHGARTAAREFNPRLPARHDRHLDRIIKAPYMKVVAATGSSDGQAFTIGKLATAANTKVETVRWYEKVGLIDAPVRTGGNYRSYTARDLSRLTFIRRARDLGFPLDQVRALLDLASEPSRDCGLVDELASGHLTTIDRKIADLAALRQALAALLTACRGGTVSKCRILEAFAPTPPG